MTGQGNSIGTFVNSKSHGIHSTNGEMEVRLGIKMEIINELGLKFFQFCENELGIMVV